MPCTAQLSGPCWRGGAQEVESTQLDELVCRRPGWKLEPLASPASPSTPALAAPVHLPPSSAASSSNEIIPEPQATPPEQDPDCSTARLQQALPAKLHTLLYFRLHPPLEQSQSGGVPHASFTVTTPQIAGLVADSGLHADLQYVASNIACSSVAVLKASVAILHVPGD